MKMSEFVLLFRMDIKTKEVQPTPEQMKVYMEQWQDWIGGIAAQYKLAIGGNHLSSEGRVISSGNVVTHEPFSEIKVSVGGYIIIKAKDFDEAVNIAKDCPILNGEGNSVEVRKVGERDDNS